MYVLRRCQDGSRICVLMTLSGPDIRRPPPRGWIQGDGSVREEHKGCWNRAQCVSKYVCETAKGIMCMCVGRGADCLRCWAPPGGAEWSYCQAPVHLLPWQQQWPRCCHGKLDTKRRGVGTGPGVMSEGQGVKGHNQLDSTQEKARVRKEGGKVCLSCFCCFYPPGPHLGGKRQMSGHHWTLALNWTMGWMVPSTSRLLEGPLH